MTTYSFSDGNVTLTGVGALDELEFLDDAGGAFDHKNFSFLKDNDDLIIFADNGNTVTITDHFAGTTERYEKLIFDGAEIALSNAIVSTGSSLTGTSNDDLLLHDESGKNGSLGRIFGRSGNDTIYAGAGNDDVYGEGGNDTIYGGAGLNVIRGGDGSDTIYGGDDRDDLRGDNGNDILYGNAGDDYLNGGTGNNTLYGGDGNDTIYGGHDDDILYGDAGDDVIIANYGDDVLYGGDGDDELNGGRDDDEIHGGEGNDRIHGWQFSGGSNVFGATEILYGDGGHDEIYTGSVKNASLYGGSGDDDYILFEANNMHTYVTIYDDSGFDDFAKLLPFAAGTTFVKVGDDLLVDRSQSGYDHDVLIIDHFLPNHHIETLQLGQPGTVYDLVEKLTTGDDTYTADATTSLFGVDENIVYAGAGNDTVSTGLANDVVYGEDGNDEVHLGSGNDYVNAGNGDDELYGDGGDDEILSSFGDDLIYGGDGADYIDGGGDDDTIYGEDGNDLIRGNSGLDTIYAGDGDDEVRSDLDEDTVYGGNGNDDLYGGWHNDALYGESGTDDLYGEDGNDLLFGGLGADTLTGGADADSFVFEAASAFNAVDTITDFDLSETDTINLADILDGFYDPLLDAITDFVEITDNGTDSFIAVDQDGGADNFVQIATLQNIIGLTDEAALETNGTLITA